jgi:hypothetical protein
MSQTKFKKGDILYIIDDPEDYGLIINVNVLEYLVQWGRLKNVVSHPTKDLDGDGILVTDIFRSEF